MQKVYLLLRDNRETGPYTIEELWQQQLKPGDMVWIEGKSTAWAYLTELELQPIVTDSESAPSSGGATRDEIEAKAEELRRRALSTSPARIYEQEKLMKESHDPEYREQEPVYVVDHRKERNNIISDLIMTLVVIGLFAGGLYSGRSLFRQESTSIKPAPTKITSADEHAAIKPVNSSPVPPETTGPERSLTDSLSLYTDRKPVREPQKQPKELTAETTRQTISKDSLPVLPKQTDTSAPPLVQAPLEEPVSREIMTEQKTITTDQPAEKKKSFGQAIKGLFKKKKKDAASDIPDSTGTNQ